jgi:large subunit ribosomal protein L3
MIGTLFGIKKNMTSTYDARGRRVGATIVEVSPHFVTQVKTEAGKDGYSAVQLGFGNKKNVKKPQMGHMKKAGASQDLRWLKEFKTEQVDVEPGTQVTVNQVFFVGDSVKVTGVSKGKGFQGGVRRHGFAGGPKTHGQSDRHRAPGSIGQTTTPGRVYKGKRMAGHMGVDTVSVRNLEVINIDKSNNLLTLKGAIPGATGSVVTITKLGVIKGYTPPPEEKIDEEEESSESAESASTEVESAKSEEIASDSADTADLAETPKEGEQDAKS